MRGSITWEWFEIKRYDRMAKIIEHNFSEKKNKKRDLLGDSLHFFLGEMEEKKELLTAMILQAREFLSMEGMNPSEFILSEPYLKEFLYTPWDGGFREGQYAEIVYLNMCSDTVTALCQFAVPEQGDYTISYQIYMRRLGESGSQRWKLYNFESKEWMEDEEDCFDMQVITQDLARFSNKD
jgi:hypothetical protein